MARNKAPGKRKSGKSGKPASATSRITYPKRFLVSLPPESNYGDPTEFFYDTPQEAIQHCTHIGPQFFIDTRYHPPVVNIIRGFEQHSGQADEAGYDCTDGAMTESMPLDVFMVVVGSGVMSVSYDPWDKPTDNWADRHGELDCDCDCDCGQCDNIFFGGKFPER